MIKQKVNFKDFSGMNTVTQSKSIPDNCSPDMQNCILKNGELITRPGFTKSGTQLWDKVLGMYACRAKQIGDYPCFLAFVDNFSHGTACGDGAVNNPGPGTGALVLMPYIVNETPVYPTGAHWCYNSATGEWEYSASGNIGQNCIAHSLMPDALKPHIAVTGDAWVNESHPDTNYGSSIRLDVRVNTDGEHTRSFIQRTDATDATLYLYYSASAYDNREFSIHKVGSWAESTITWNNQPALGDLITTWVIPNVTGWYSIGIGTATSICIKFTDETTPTTHKLAIFSSIDHSTTEMHPYLVRT